jgi:hypothetical protein
MQTAIEFGRPGMSCVHCFVVVASWWLLVVFDFVVATTAVELLKTGVIHSSRSYIVVDTFNIYYTFQQHVRRNGTMGFDVQDISVLGSAHDVPPARIFGWFDQLWQHFLQ